MLEVYIDDSARRRRRAAAASYYYPTFLQHGCFAVRECVFGCNTNFEFLATDMVVAAITLNTYILECPICFRDIIILLKAHSRLIAFKSQQEKEDEKEEEEWLTIKKIFFFAVFFARFTTERKKETSMISISSSAEQSPQGGNIGNIHYSGVIC